MRHRGKYLTTTCTALSRAHLSPLDCRWGSCFENSLWIHHFQKDVDLMERRYRRAAAGKSICGDGFPENVVCGMAEQGKALTLECLHGKKIHEVLFASYGKQKLSAPGPCAEGMDALTIDPECHHAGSSPPHCTVFFSPVRHLGATACQVIAGQCRPSSATLARRRPISG